jgi:hypothetical protein
LKVVCDEVDSLKPYGYLLGRVDDDKSEVRSSLAQKVRKIAKRVPKVRR